MEKKEMDVSDSREWNYDRIVSAMAQINEVNRDMAIVLHRGYVSGVMRERMKTMLQSAASEVSRLVEEPDK